MLFRINPQQVLEWQQTQRPCPSLFSHASRSGSGRQVTSVGANQSPKSLVVICSAKSFRELARIEVENKKAYIVLYGGEVRTGVVVLSNLADDEVPKSLPVGNGRAQQHGAA